MDSEEQEKIREADRQGKPQTDEGPYYHEAWWESYKGGVRGKIGGALIGAVIGAGVGVMVAAILPLVSVVGVSFGAVVAGFSAAGMLYNAHDFNEVGHNAGADSAVAEKLEKRMKNFEEGKFAEVKQQIAEIKGLLTGSNETPQKAVPAGESDPYPTRHYENTEPQGHQWMFWKVAAMGLVIGAAAGGLLGYSGVAADVLHLLGPAFAKLEGTTATIASMTALGAFGASFGINRDLFRQIFDKTDLWFKGIFTRDEGREPQPAMEIIKTVAQSPVKPRETTITTIVYEDSPDYPKSDTFHRDKVVASAKQALLSLDPTNARPH